MAPVRVTVLDGGFLTTVQDAGRSGWARYGVPPSGVLDPAALRAANRLVGNPAGAAALEITLQGPVLAFDDDRVIALCGADFEGWIGRRPLPGWCACRVSAGERVVIRGGGGRAVLAVSGGLALPSFLESQSTYLSGGFGGLEGRGLRAGDFLPLNLPDAGFWERAGAIWPRALRPSYSTEPILRVAPGPQLDDFTAEGLAAFWDGSYEVLPASDRMGCRLRGAVVTRRSVGELVSDGVVRGTVQVPPDGQPIVMLADHQTTGGYPKLGAVIQADWPLLAQCLPGMRVRFQPIEAVVAQAAWRAIVEMEAVGPVWEPDCWG